jgi:hypothetical protein
MMFRSALNRIEAHSEKYDVGRPNGHRRRRRLRSRPQHDPGSHRVDAAFFDPSPRRSTSFRNNGLATPARDVNIALDSSRRNDLRYRFNSTSCRSNRDDGAGRRTNSTHGHQPAAWGDRGAEDANTNQVLLSRPSGASMTTAWFMTETSSGTAR